MDAHKNLPGLKLLYEKYHSAEWYIIIDDDTYVIFENMLHLVSHLNPSKPHYVGLSARFVGCDGVKKPEESTAFAHGGSGILLSRAAVQVLMQSNNESQSKRIDDCMLKYKLCWAGDVRTALCLRDNGIYLEKSIAFNSESLFSDNFRWTRAACTRPIIKDWEKNNKILIEGDFSEQSDNINIQVGTGQNSIKSNAQSSILGPTYSHLFHAIYGIDGKGFDGIEFEKDFDRSGNEFSSKSRADLRIWALKVHAIDQEISDKLEENESNNTIGTRTEELYAKICLQFCKSESFPGCISWTWNPVSGKCLLKDNLTEKISQIGFFSGIFPGNYLCYQ
ncbi:hypothetical protein HK096_003284 [Nowakowskiella sp. JEL0078]|nr:hypothetical protein HK096_003284 [Nowakowskiella sp. JEL0078]